MAVDTLPSTEEAYLEQLVQYNDLPDREQRIDGLSRLLEVSNYREIVGEVAFGHSHWLVAWDQKSMAQDHIAALGCFFDDWQPEHNQANELRHIKEARTIANRALAGLKLALNVYKGEKCQFSRAEYVLNQAQQAHLDYCVGLVEECKKEYAATKKIVRLIKTRHQQIKSNSKLLEESEVLPTVDEQQKFTEFEKRLEELEVLTDMKRLARRLNRFVSGVDKETIATSYNRSDYAVGLWNLAMKVKGEASQDEVNEFPYLEIVKKVVELAEYLYTFECFKQECQQEIEETQQRLDKLDVILTQEDKEREQQEFVEKADRVTSSEALMRAGNEQVTDCEPMLSKETREAFVSISALPSRKRPVSNSSLVEADSTISESADHLPAYKKPNR